MTRQVSLTTVLNFGKHVGEQVEDLLYDDPGYLAWAVHEEVIEPDDELRKQMEDLKII